MNILITGGLGYIGGRLANWLKDKQPESCIFLTTRNKNVDLPSWTDRFTILQMDVLGKASIASCLEKREIDVIIHLAAVNEIDSMEDPSFALEVNTQGTYNLLTYAKANGVDRFIYFSTFHVYGEISDKIITENFPARPFHPYAISHRAAEDFVTFFNYYHGIKTLILRLSNGYGYPMDIGVNRWTLVFNDLCRQVVTSRRMILKSSGKAHRDFISLYDISRAIEHFLFIVPDKWGDGIYNLGGNCSMSILDVAIRIADVYRRKYGKNIIEIKITQNGNRSSVPKKVNSSIVKYDIQKILDTGFTLQGDMNSEIEMTMNVCEKFVE